MLNPISLARCLDRNHAKPLLLFALVLSLTSGCGEGRQASPVAVEKQRALQITDPELRAKELSRIAATQSAAGDQGGAEQTLGEAASAAEQVTDAKGRAAALNSIASSLGKMGRSFDAKRLARKIESAASSVEDMEARVGIFARLAMTQALYLEERSEAEAHLAAARQDAERVERPVGRVEALMTVAVAWFGIEARDTSDQLVEAALAAARDISDQRDQANALMHVASRLGRMGQAEQSRTVLAEARQAAERIDDPLSQAYAYADLGREFHAAGDTAAAQQLFDQSHRLGDAVDSSMRSSLMEKIEAARQGR